MSNKKTNKKCPITHSLTFLGGKWALPIIYKLGNGKKRFKELERAVEGISTRMLVKELKAMVSHKVITRKAYATVPPTVEYELTTKGEELFPMLNELFSWSEKYYPPE